MKPRTRHFIRRELSLIAVVVTGMASSAQAASITWSNSGTDFNAGASWIGSTAPGSNDIATFTGAKATDPALSAPANVKGLGYSNGAASGYTISGSTLTVGTSGIDASAVTSGTNSITSNLTLAGGPQVWSVGTGSTLSFSTGTFTRGAGATLLIDKSVNTGTVSASSILNTNSIVGPWAAVFSTGTAANASPDGLTYATKDLSGNLVPYVSATSTTFSGTINTASTNYDQTGAGNSSTRGVGLTANTVRNITSTAATLVFSTGSLTTNGLMTAGAGALTIGSAAGQGGLIIGTGNDLNLVAATANITANSVISGATGASVTVAGPNTVTFGGTNTFTGNLVINSGTLTAATGQGATPTASNLGALQPAANRNIIVNNLGILSLTGGNVLGTGGSTNTLSNTTLVVNPGGVFQSGLNAAGAGWWNKIGATTLNGGTIHAGSGANTTTFQALALIGTVTVTGSSASTIDNFSASNAASNGIHLGQNATASQSITFDVADVTNSSAQDLIISAKLLNTSSTLTASGLTKTGAGTMTLTGTNAYTGATTISNGVLQIGDGITDGSIATTSAVTNNAALAFNLVGSQTFAKAIGGTGSLTKTGAGALTISVVNGYTGATNVTGGKLVVTGSINSTSGVAVTSGTLDGTGSVAATTIADSVSNVLANGNLSGSGALVLGSLTFSGDATVNVRSAGSAGIVVTGALSTTPANGQVTINADKTGWSLGLNNLISYGSFGGSIGDFTLGTLTGLSARQSASSLVLNGSAIAVNVTGDLPVWTGASGEVWNTATDGDNSGSNNWATKTAHTATNFWVNDIVEFNDTYNLGAGDVAVTQNYVSIATDVSPSSMTFNNSLVDYTIDSYGNGVSTGSLIKNGSAQTTLVGNHTYTGPTTINAGTLRLGDSTFDGTIPNTSSVTNNAALIYNWSTNHTAAYPISGTGTLTKQGVGTLTLSNASAGCSGGTIVSGGTLVANAAGLSVGPISIGSTGTLTFTGANAINSSTVTGSGAILNNTANTTILTGDHTGFSGTFTHNSAVNNTQFNTAASSSQNASYTLTAGELIFAANGDYTVKMGALSSAAGNIRGGNTATGTTTLEVGNLGVDTTVAGNINNGATKGIALTKVGAGILTLTGTNTFAGPALISSGTLRVNGAGAITASSGITINGSSAAYVNNSSVAGTRPIGLTEGLLDGTGSVGAVTVADNANSVISNGAGGTSPLTMAALTLNGDATFNAKISNLTPWVVTGALTTTPANGLVTINVPGAFPNGLLNLISFGSLAGGASPSDFTVSMPGLSARQTPGSPVLNGNNIAVNISGEIPVWSGANGANWTAATSGDSSGPNNWATKTGHTGTNFWSGDNVEFNDTYNIGAGNVAVTQTAVTISDFGVQPATTIFNNSVVDYSIESTGDGIQTGSLTLSGTKSVTLLGTHVYTGATTINAGTLQLGNGTTDGTIANTALVTNNGTLAYNWATNHTVPYVISGSGSLTKTGAGTLTITGNNGYSGGTSITTGAITLAGGGALGSGAINLGSGTNLNINNAPTIANTVSGGGTITTTNTTTVTGNFGGFTGNFVHNSTTTSVAFNTASSTSQNAAYQIASAQGSAQGMIAGGNGDYTLKLGALSGVANSLFRGGNTATGITTLEIGNLGTNTGFAGSINNGVTKTLALTKVGSGKLTLEGASNYAGATLVSAGTLAVTGSLGATDVTVQSGATLGGNGNLGGAVTIQSGGRHALAVADLPANQVTRTITGLLTLSGGDIVDLTAASAPAAGTYVVATATGGITGTLTSSTINYNGITGTLAINGSNLELTVTSGSAYDTWADLKDLTVGVNDGPTQDPENDGIDNVLEFVLGGDPLASDTGILPDLDASGANFVFSFNRSDDSEAEVTLTFQYGNSLTGWTEVVIGADNAASGSEVNIVEDSTNPDQITVTVPKVANTKLFGRLRAVKN